VTDVTFLCKRCYQTRIAKKMEAFLLVGLSGDAVPKEQIGRE
jgi:hypothetical protein